MNYNKAHHIKYRQAAITGNEPFGYGRFVVNTAG